MPIDQALLRRSWQAWIDSDLDRVGPLWLQWLWTLVFAAALALAFTVLAMANGAGAQLERWLDGGRWMRNFSANFVITGCISVLIHGLYSVLIPWIGRARIVGWSHARRAFFFVGVGLSGVVIGWPLGLWLLGQRGRPLWTSDPDRLVGSVAIGLVISVGLFLFFNARARRAVAEKRAAEAQLRLLQGQMEPHFLFNTLANVLTLIDAEPARAKAMLESLTDYLRATLADLRHASSSVGHELALAEAYLRLLQLRMEDRLRYTIDADEASRHARLPPLLLQPLVENAIRHGLEPKIEGGHVHIRAHVADGRLILSVSDDGLGLGAPSPAGGGNGVALANVRERLWALHGDEASLALQPLQPGTRATLSLPHADADALAPAAAYLTA